MSQINIRNLSNENDDGSPEIVGVSTFSATSFFVPPKGSTAERPSDCEPGSIRFNTDTANLEYFRGKTLGWSQFELINPNLGGGTGSNTGTGTRGIFGSGEAPHGDTIDFLTISTFGDSTDFGDLTQDRRSGGSMGSSETRGLFAGGQHPSPFTFFNIIDFVTIASTGNATDFGDLENKAYNVRGFSSRTRGVAACTQKGPSFAAVNTIEYVTIASTGNANDFGDTSTIRTTTAGAASSTRGVFGGGGYIGDTTYCDEGTASRFFYSTKSSVKERTHNRTIENNHPTVKNMELMKYLIKLVTPKGGTVYDPFAGSGVVPWIAKEMRRQYIGVELDKEVYDKSYFKRLDLLDRFGKV